MGKLSSGVPFGPSVRLRRILGSTCVLGALVLLPRAASAQVTVSVDPTKNAHAISPLIYGMNFASSAQMTQGNVPLTRWGGNSTTRYNYQIDVTNTGADYYFENVAGCWDQAGNYCSPAPTDPMGQSGANVFLMGAKQAGVHALFDIPTIGFVSKGPPPYAQPLPCGCPKSANGNQDSYDPYDTSCGNGEVGGQYITCPDPTTTTSSTVTSQWSEDWVKYLTTTIGPSNGNVIYELDNEPNLWNQTHHDVHPLPTTYDELWSKMQATSEAILASDPTALVAGFEEWGWPNYFCSAQDTAGGASCSATSPDRAAHGGEDLTSWVLDQAAAYEKSKGTRILHALDLHYYPQGGNPPDNLRSLWDPTYTDPSWINSIIMLIPRMHQWVAQHYPGTLIGVSEYQWQNYDTPLAVVTYAEILGIFGQQALDYATAWSPPAPTDNAFAAFLLYRDYDGKGATFQSVGVDATVTGTGFQAYASVSATQMTVVLVNEGSASASTMVNVGNFVPNGAGHYYEVSGTGVGMPSSVTFSGASASLSVSATTAGILVVDGTNPNMLPDAGAADAGGCKTCGADGGGGKTGDASVSSGTDAASGGEGGVAVMGAGDDGGTASPEGSKGGCGCRVVSARAGDSFAGAVGVLGLVGAVLRRRRRGTYELS